MSARKPPPIRTTTYTPEMGARICQILSSYPRGLKAMLAEHQGLPSRDTLYHWRNTIPDFATMWETARECQMELWLEDCLDIADDSSGDVRIIGHDDSEREVCNTEFVNRSKLRVETRLKMIEKIAPKKFGPKADVNLGGAVKVVFSDADKGVL